MRHSVLSQEDRAGAARGHRPKAIVGIGDRQSGARAREPDRGTEQDAARHRQIGGRAGEKAAAEREIDAGLLDRCQQRRDGRGECWPSASNVTSASARCSRT